MPQGQLNIATFLGAVPTWTQAYSFADIEILKSSLDAKWAELSIMRVNYQYTDTPSDQSTV